VGFAEEVQNQRHVAAALGVVVNQQQAGILFHGFSIKPSVGTGSKSGQQRPSAKAKMPLLGCLYIKNSCMG